MKKRKLLTQKCPCCGEMCVVPITVFKLPAELNLLADSLKLPADTVIAMLARGDIKMRRRLDEAGRPRGPRVLFADALEAVRALREHMS